MKTKKEITDYAPIIWLILGGSVFLLMMVKTC